MNEPEILEAYRDLSAPIGPPDDLVARVDRRIRRRRRTRRGVAALAALAVAGGIGVVTLLGNEADIDRGVVADPGGSATSTLQAIDADGSQYSFAAEDIDVSCRAITPLGDTQSRDELVLIREGERHEPTLYVSLLVDAAQPGRVFHLPFDERDASELRPMTVLLSTDGGADGNDELSSARAGSSGTLVVHEASCGPIPSLWIEIDGALGSRLEQPPVAVKGEYRS